MVTGNPCQQEAKTGDHGCTKPSVGSCQTLQKTRRPTRLVVKTPNLLLSLEQTQIHLREEKSTWVRESQRNPGD